MDANLENLEELSNSTTILGEEPDRSATVGQPTVEYGTMLCMEPLCVSDEKSGLHARTCQHEHDYSIPAQVITREDTESISMTEVAEPNFSPNSMGVSDTFGEGILEEVLRPIFEKCGITINMANPQSSNLGVYPELSVIPETVIETEPAVDMPEQGQEIAIHEPTMISGRRSIDGMLLSSLRKIKLLLIYEGYYFRRYYAYGLKIRWQCVNSSCGAFIYSYGNKVKNGSSDHNHSIICQNITTTHVSVENSVQNDSVLITSSPKTQSPTIIDETVDHSAIQNNVSITSIVNITNESIDHNSPQTCSTPIIPSQYSVIVSEATMNSTHQIALEEDMRPSCTFVGPAHITVGNSLIPIHDPSLEVTVKANAITEGTFEDISSVSITENIKEDSYVAQLPMIIDPMQICTATYTPNPVTEWSFSTNPTYDTFDPQIFEDKIQITRLSNPFAHLEPKATKTLRDDFSLIHVPICNDKKIYRKGASDIAKVTLTGPMLSEPQVFHDGKLMPVKRKIYAKKCYIGPAAKKEKMKQNA